MPSKAAPRGPSPSPSGSCTRSRGRGTSCSSGSRSWWEPTWPPRPAPARALQLFDSWVGCLSPADYATYVFPHSQRALELAASSGVPVIHFGADTAGLLADFARAGGDVIGVDWRIPLDVAWQRIASAAIQGNLDPVALLAPRAELERQ